MDSRPRALELLLTALLITLPACGSPASSVSSEAWEDSFSGDAIGADWRTGTANRMVDAEDAHWNIREGRLALTDPRGHTGQAYNLLWRESPRLADVELEVRVRAVSGVEDQGGGPAWRVMGEDDYYVTRWNPLEDNFRVYSVVEGVRTELASAEVKADPAEWHTLGVRHVGTRITCSFDGRELLSVEDTALAAAGGVGLWTKADACTAFDDLRVGPAE